MELCYPSGSIGIYLTFPNSKNIIPRTRLFNDAMCEHLLPNFHTSDLWSRTCDQRVTMARPWREINRQASVRSKFRECSVQPTLPSISILLVELWIQRWVKWALLIRTTASAAYETQVKPLATDSELLSDSNAIPNATLMLLLPLRCLTPKRGASDSGPYGISSRSSIDVFVLLIEIVMKKHHHMFY